MISQNFIYLAAAVNSFGGITYLISTLRGQIKPNRMTWFLWALAPLIIFAAEMNQQVGLIALITFLNGFFPLLIFLASFRNKKSHWHLSTFDFTCGGLSLLGLVLWYVTKSGNTAIIFSILADFLAGTPTLFKAYSSPKTESPWAYLLGVMGAGISLLTITTWSFANSSFLIYLVLMNGAIFIAVYFKIVKFLRK